MGGEGTPEGEMVVWHHRLDGHKCEYWLFIALGGLSSSCGQQGLPFVAMQGLLTVVGVSCCGAQAPEQGLSSWQHTSSSL